jgi:hypothetical protein
MNLDAAMVQVHHPTDKGQADRRLFARVSVRGLSAEQLYDSLMVAAGNVGLARVIKDSF